MPAVSCIITSTRPHLLDRAIASVRAQTYRDYELIVLDQPGIIGAIRNEGVRRARGEFIAFLDDDDEWMPRKLEKQINRFQIYPWLGIVYSWFFKGVRTVAPHAQGNIHRHLLWAREFSGSASNPMLKMSAVHAAGDFNPLLQTSEDWELYLRMTERYQVSCIHDYLTVVHPHSGPRLGDKVRQAGYVEQLVLRRYWHRMSWPLRARYLGKLFMHSSPALTGWKRRVFA